MTEGGWDAGAASGCLAAAGLLQAGAPISLAILLALIGAAVVFVLLRRYYRARSNRWIPSRSDASLRVD
jgi:membrane protein implicated in regulation of membrane protease activity